MKCCICGTVKNCSEYLDKIFFNMQVIGMLFQDYKIILYYDHSKDDTLDKLKKYKLMNPKYFHFYVNTDPPLPYRTHNIAKGRNKCLEIIREKYSDYEYFIMMDCDDVCSGFLKQPLLHYYLMRNDWDSLSFNHPNGYYDVWALSKDPLFLSCSCFQNGQKLYMNYITNIIQKTPANELIPCFSAFNGFAIYRTKKFLNCSYDGTSNNNYIPPEFIQKNILAAGNILSTNLKEDCEHRRFHFQAIKDNNARIRISPQCLFIKSPIKKLTLF
jgi:hypothetical protein